MLQSLSTIVQRVNAAPDLQSALNIIVRDVRSSMGTEVCTVYMADHDEGRLVFAATEGLNREELGNVSLNFGQGLVGKVASREEPINTSNAQEHPDFQYLEDIGEEAFNSFLGVPIVHHRTVLGVLVVQQTDRRSFDESEEAFLLTMAAQLASVIAHAQATGALEPSNDRTVVNAEFRGIAGASGVAIGQALVVSPPADLYSVPSRRSRDIYEELVFFRACVSRVRKDVALLSSQLADRLPPEELALFEVYAKMLDQHALPAEIEALIEAGEWAQGAVARVVLAHLRQFEQMENSYLSERAVDVKDLGRRLLEYLQQAAHEPMIYPENVILVGNEITATMLAEVPREKLAGIVSLKGSHNSHVAILARSMGVPTVMGAVDLPFTEIEGNELIVDGYAGVVFFNPSLELRASYQQIAEEEQLVSRGLEALKDLSCETTDGHKISLMVNTGLASDVSRSLDRGAEGVGLYRTEVPFLMRDRFPSEEEQRAIYRMHLEAFAPKPVTMRTLDVGGDKSLPYFLIHEDNPFLGWRGIRVTLDHPEIFLPQVRAMMKASEGIDNLRIMLPMITHMEELDQSIALIKRAYKELLDEDFKINFPSIGVMIEVPAAIYLTREMASKVDFISVGSNDLTQYLLAVDRNNPNVADLYLSYHPAVLQSLQLIVLAAHEVNKPVSICGELASDPGAALLLLAMGYDSLSMNATNLPKVKSVIRAFSKQEADHLLQQVMLMDSADRVQTAVEDMLESRGVTRLFRDSRRERDAR
ncbi:MAG: phosphoenolpyruvate--protein phosphotransferase [Gammaproteobacteria bacterium]|nr:phosphoenolpyruvate--protein phosphotransferase [Gammaproteobacteria bacterium]MBT8151649.1 phosphoenolpyruvate--protein phosphotransferase [Gammaproteobacteria bacterium]NND40285.1 phosphoenolpyruvate--protein phosphotransferase [Pseudomonadales bacterium]NNM12076.1 phosphoenolpyruvate--protein phosphotransferase [Pseudomonadales bacterium]RZV59986.1 MAG: phosphoenolpyruvate--protein phosphotransferase [Pseudomonadales bacterium]